jgi:hypothetical protein
MGPVVLTRRALFVGAIATSIVADPFSRDELVTGAWADANDQTVAVSFANAQSIEDVVVKLQAIDPSCLTDTTAP